MTRTLKAHQLTGPVAEHGEGPVWHPDFAGPRFVDMLQGDIVEFDGEQAGRWHVGEVAAAFRPRRGGGLVVGTERGFTLLDTRLQVERRLPDLWDDHSIRMNDGGCDPDGGFWCGSMAYDQRPGAAALYRLAPDLTAEKVLDGVTVSNGFGFSPDGAVLYYVDTPTSRIDAFDYGGGASLAGRRTVVEIPDDAGVPDGLTVDADGHLWVALHGGSAVRRYSPDGSLDAIVELPVTQVTACTFGGPDLDRLYITTSREAFGPEEIEAQPSAGALFAIDPGVRGLPVLDFAG